MTEPRDTTPYTEDNASSVEDEKPLKPFTDPAHVAEHRAHERHFAGSHSDVGEPITFTDPDAEASRRAARNAVEEQQHPPDYGMDAVIDEVDQRTSGLLQRVRRKLTGDPDSSH